jgi:hypothetical protein
MEAINAVAAHSGSIGRDQNLTVENGTGEVAKELEEQVLFLRSQFIETSMTSATLHVSLAEASGHVRLEPLVGSLESKIALSRNLALLPELPFWNLFGVFIILSSDGRSAPGLAIAVDVADEGSVFIRVTASLELHVGVKFDVSELAFLGVLLVGLAVASIA